MQVHREFESLLLRRKTPKSRAEFGAGLGDRAKLRAKLPVPMFQVSIGPYSLRVSHDRLPPTYAEATRRAQLVDEFDLASSDGTLCCVEVGNGNAWPFLLVAQRYAPSADCF